MNPEVTAFIGDSQRWPGEMEALRTILLGCGLDEEFKWAKPCYCHDGANIVILQEMNDFLAAMFFKGALLEDPDSLLRTQGPNSRSARRLEFTSVAEVNSAAPAVRALVDSAVAVQEAGLEVEPAPPAQPSAELQSRLEADPALAEAFAGLTPGRRREYDLYVSSAKKAATREARVDRCVQRILAGKGLRDR